MTSNKFKPSGIPNKKSKIRPTETKSEKISFNFHYLKTNCNKFKFDDLDSSYFCTLLDKIKTYSNYTRKQLDTDQSLRKTIRHHKIDFTEKGVDADSFGIPDGGRDLFHDAYQFVLTSNAHGRIHGFYIGDVFHIVWLDPLHLLYPKKK